METNIELPRKSSELSLDIPVDFPFQTGSNDFIIPSDEDIAQKEGCMTAMGEWVKNTSRKVFSKKTLYKRLPILTWLPKYDKQDAVGDLVAGITVGLTVIPQGLAYAGIAGLPIQYGLYGSFLGCFVYIFLGSSKDVPVGPTAIASFLVFQTAQGVWQRAVLLTFLTGIIEVLMGIFRLGFLIDFVSGPVSAGFISAASLIILASQMRDIFGVNASGNTFLRMLISINSDIHNIRWTDTALGFSCIFILLAMRLMVNFNVGPKDVKEQKWWHKGINNTIWLIGTARNAVLVVSCGFIGYIMFSKGTTWFRLIGHTPSGLPTFQLPPFSYSLTYNNSDGESVYYEESFGEMVANMGSGLIVIPLISLLENISVCQTFANGKPVDATQELIAVGIANIANSFAQGFRGNGALARGAVNNASGVRTPLGNVYTGTLVIIALLFFTPYFFFIPKASLAAVIIAAVIFMIQYRVVKPMWRSKKTDLIPGLAAFFACLVLPIQIGILVGIGINVVFILYHSARPKLQVEKLTTSSSTEYMMLTPDRCLIFPSVEFVRNVVNKQGSKTTLPVVIDCTHIYGADYTAARVIATMIQDFKFRNQDLYFYNLKPSVAQVFEGVSSELVVLYSITALEMALAGRDKELHALT